MVGDLTLERAVAEHRKMWNWIADATEKQKGVVLKSDYFRKFCDVYRNVPTLLCWCCEYSSKSGDVGCESCPVEFDMTVTGCLGGLYDDYEEERDWKKRAEIARRIANLPVRKDLEKKKDR